MRKVMWLSCVLMTMSSMLILSGCNCEKKDACSPCKTSDGSTYTSDIGRDSGTLQRDIITVAKDSGQFTIFDRLVNKAGLTDTLKGAGPYTVFAPNDQAFDKLPANVLDNLMLPEHKDHLRQILQYHVASGKMMARDLKNMDRFDTISGKYSKLSTRDGQLRVDNARIITADIKADNGIIHEIDTVLIPSGLQNEVQKMEKSPVSESQKRYDRDAEKTIQQEKDKGTDQNIQTEPQKDYNKDSKIKSEKDWNQD